MNSSRDKNKQTGEKGKQMLIGVHIGNKYGSQQGAWCMPGVDPQSYTSYIDWIKRRF